MLKYFSSYGIGLLCAATVLAYTSMASAITFSQSGFTETIVANIPGAIPYGSLELDALGNIYSVNLTNQITKFTPAGAAFTFASISSSLANSPFSNLNSLERVGNSLYMGGFGLVFESDLSNGSTTLLGSTGTFVNGIALAPSSFGPFGGDLILATNAGLMTMDISTGVAGAIFRGGNYSDVVFSTTGELIAAKIGSSPTDVGGVQRIQSNGTILAQASIGINPDGLAINPSTGNIYAAESQLNQLFEIDPVTFAFSIFASSVNLSEGTAPSALAFSNDGGSLYLVVDGGSSNVLLRLDGFPAVSTCENANGCDVPEPTTLAIFGIGLVGLAGMRRRRNRLGR